MAETSNKTDCRDAVGLFFEPKPKLKAGGKLTLDDLGDLSGALAGAATPIARSAAPAPARQPERRSKVRSYVREAGDLPELKAQLIGMLEEALARAKGDEPRALWEPRSDSWPYTKLGLSLHKAISLADQIADSYLSGEFPPE